MSNELQDRSYNLIPQGGVAFNESDHIYSNADGEIYRSSTGILKDFKNEFDSEGMSKYKAIKEILNDQQFYKLKKAAGGWDKVSTYWDLLLERSEFASPLINKRQEFLDIWKSSGEKAALRGSIEHNKREQEVIENGFYWDNKYYPHSNKNVLEVNNREVCTIPELLLWDHSIKLGGLADLPLFEKGYVHIHDFKTNKEIKMEAFNGQKLRGIMNHVPDCSFYHYSLQLEIYSRMACKLTGFKPGENWIISTANEEYGRPDDVYIQCADMKKEVDMIYDAYGN